MAKQLDYVFKFGDYDFAGMIKADTYEINPNARQDMDSYRDANGKLHRTALKHTATSITFSIRPHTKEEHEKMMKAIIKNYMKDSERDANCSYYDPEYCKYKTGHFYIDSNMGFHMYSNAKGLPMYGEKEFSLVEY